MATVDIVYPICCGMDIHKNFLVACIATTDERSNTTHHIRRFSTYTNDLHRLSDWLAANNCRDVCMESTGKYWIPVFNVLEKTCTVCLTHPKYVKLIYVGTSEKNRAQNCLTMCNFKLDDVFSDVFGTSATRIINQMLEHGDSDFDIALCFTNAAKQPLSKYSLR